MCFVLGLYFGILASSSHDLLSSNTFAWHDAAHKLLKVFMTFQNLGGGEVADFTVDSKTRGGGN